MKQWSHGRTWRICAEAAGVGLLAGLILSIYRLWVPLLAGYFQALYAWGRLTPLRAFLCVAALAGLGLGVGYLTQLEPRIGGSGIPQVTAQRRGLMKISWRKVLPLKFTGGLLALAAGLTVGREGPSIQMGASLGQAVGDLLRRPAEERIELLTAGAAAGLTAAFHAPLSGVVFALEELSQGFNKAVLLPAAVAALAADAVQSWILGTAPVLNFGLFPHLGPHELLLLIPLGVLLALLAYCFTEGISFVKRLYQMLPCPLALKIALAFSLSTLAVLFKPILFGAGGELIALPLTEGELSLSYLAFLLCSKFLLLLIAFSSGMPGGIFFPMLVLGSLCGQLWALFLVHMTWLSPDLILAYGILGMAASFVAIVRSPLTGMLLILELTGSFRMLLPLLLVALVAYLAAEEMGVEPVYERLLRHQLDPQSLRWGYRRPLDAET